MKNTILIIIALAAFLGFLIMAGDYGIKLHEVSECHRWAREAKEYPGYYLLDWQKAQCAFHNIELWTNN